MRRLEGAGLVEAEEGRLRATRAGKRVVRMSTRWRDGIRSITPKIEATLRDHVPFPEDLGAWSLSDSDWERAYDEYRRAARP